MDRNLQMKNLIASLNDKKPKLLLHACCAPCSSAVLEKLKDYFEITIFYYNPNIMPKEEFEKRKAEFEKLKAICDFKFVAPAYNNDAFLQIAKGMESEIEGGARCRACIAHRISETKKFADENGFDFFCSTLSISPHKNADYINIAGFSLENGKTKWLPNDFKKENGFLRSTQLCKELNIYRQSYCGCKFE